MTSMAMSMLVIQTAMPNATTHSSIAEGSLSASQLKPNSRTQAAMFDVAASGGTWTAAIIVAPARLPIETRARGQVLIPGHYECEVTGELRRSAKLKASLKCEGNLVRSARFAGRRS